MHLSFLLSSPLLSIHILAQSRKYFVVSLVQRINLRRVIPKIYSLAVRGEQLTYVKHEKHSKSS